MLSSACTPGLVLLLNFLDACGCCFCCISCNGIVAYDIWLGFHLCTATSSHQVLDDRSAFRWCELRPERPPQLFDSVLLVNWLVHFGIHIFSLGHLQHCRYMELRATATSGHDSNDARLQKVWDLYIHHFTKAFQPADIILCLVIGCFT